jgi:hypothetical protein
VAGFDKRFVVAIFSKQISVLVRGFAVAAVTTISIATTFFGSAANAYTMTSPLSIPFCVGCGIPGQVSVTDNGTGTLAFQVSLFGTYQFVGGVDAFAFNVANSPNITFANFAPALAPDSFTGSNTSAANVNLGSFGPFMYGVTAPGAGPDGQSLDFDVTANGGLTLSDVLNASNGHLFGNTFAVHVCPVSAAQCDNSDNGYAFTFIGGGFTPAVAFTETSLAEAPVPAALPLFASVLGGGLLFARWRRKRKVAAGAP